MDSTECPTLAEAKRYIGLVEDDRARLEALVRAEAPSAQEICAELEHQIELLSAAAIRMAVLGDNRHTVRVCE